MYPMCSRLTLQRAERQQLQRCNAKKGGGGGGAASSSASSDTSVDLDEVALEVEADAVREGGGYKVEGGKDRWGESSRRGGWGCIRRQGAGEGGRQGRRRSRSREERSGVCVGGAGGGCI
jgi:hypothetical protein